METSTAGSTVLPLDQRILQSHDLSISFMGCTRTSGNIDLAI